MGNAFFQAGQPFPTAQPKRSQPPSSPHRVHQVRIGQTVQQLLLQPCKDLRSLPLLPQRSRALLFHLNHKDRQQVEADLQALPQ